MDRSLAYDRANFALCFLRQTLQEGARTGDFTQANYWAIEFLERRALARQCTKTVR